jgi:hypothetical protein
MLKKNLKVNDSVDLTCKRFCKDFALKNCITLNKEMNSTIFKAVEKESGKTVCFKFIPKSEYYNDNEKIDILDLLRRFVLF